MKLILTFVLFALPAFSAPVQGDLFMSTTPVQTPSGQVHMEVQAFEINSSADMNRVVQELSAKTKATRSKELFHVEVRARGYRNARLENVAQNGAAEIESGITAENRMDPKPVSVEAPKGFFKRNYNVSLAFIRFLSNGAVVASGLVIGKGIAMEHALLIGALAGTLSATVQLKSDVIFKWLSNSVLLVNAAKKAGVLPVTEAPGVTERTLKQVEMYSRWAILETGFLLAIQTGMALLNMPVAENLLLTVGKSTLSQGVFEIGVLKASQQLAGINEKWAGKSAVFKNVALFAGSGISVLAAVGSMVDMPFANLGFAALTATGVVLTFSSKITKIKPVEQILALWRVSKPRCAFLLQTVK
jgi:hypothetical protein